MSIDINNYEAAVSHALEQDLEIKFPAEFTDEQRRAIAALVRGQGMVAAAKAAGVHRATLRRWIDQGGAFHRFLRQEQGKRLHIQREVVPITDEAAHVVARAIRAGDARTALAVLRALGVFEGVKEDIAAAAGEEVAGRANVAVSGTPGGETASPAQASPTAAQSGGASVAPEANAEGPVAPAGSGTGFPLHPEP